jgi:LysM repeat protein
MNNPSPLLPQGSLQSSRGNPNVRIAIFAIIAIHAVFFTGILMQGCKRESTPPLVADAPPVENEFPSFDSEYYQSFQDIPPVSTELPQVAQPERTLPSTTPTPPQVREPVNNFQSSFSAERVDEPAAEWREYQVARGDTLWKIANDHNLSVPEMVRANPGIEPNRLRVGQTIQIPAKSAASAATEMVAPENGRIHVVKAGENLTKIARTYSTTVSALKAANNLSTDRIAVGQRLRVPAPQNSSAGAGSFQPESRSASGSEVPVTRY